MKLITCLDDKNGLLFNNRRQSQDRVLRAFIKDMVKDSKVYMNSYTYELYKDLPNTVVCDDFLEKADNKDYCLMENCPVKQFEDRIEELILFRWNKIYPADMYFDLELSSWHLKETEEFEGSTHHIRKETYIKEKSSL